MTLIHKWAIGLLLFSATCCVWVFHADAGSTKAPDKKQIQRIETKLHEESGKLQRFRSKEKELLKLVAQFEEEVADTRLETKRLTANIDRVNAQLTGQKAQLETLKRSLREVEGKIGRFLVALYKYYRQGNIRLLAAAGTINDLQRNIKYIGIITKEDRKKLRLLAKQASECQNDVSSVEASIGETAQLLKQKRLTLASLETTLDEKVLLLMKVHEEREFYETSVEELETAVADLENSLDTIEKENPYALDSSLTFEDCKGELPMPVRGRIIRDRERRGTPLSSRNGVVIRADGDSAVRAVFKGEVVYSGHLKGYGEVVILDHGGRFFTVSAHLSKREKMEGDMVKGGDVVGRVNENGAVRGASVYFEVRKADKKLNPRAWLKTVP